MHGTLIQEKVLNFGSMQKQSFFKKRFDIASIVQRRAAVVMPKRLFWENCYDTLPKFGPFARAVLFKNASTLS